MTALLVGGCAAPAEEPLIQQFFAASRLRDKTALQAFSTVVFEPAKDGIVTSFEITRVTAGQPGGVGTPNRTSATKHVTLRAPVKLPDGGTAQKTLVVTMERRAERWIITGVAAFQR